MSVLKRWCLWWAVAIMLLQGVVAAQTQLGPIGTTTQDLTGQNGVTNPIGVGKCRIYYDLISGSEIGITSTGSPCGPSINAAGGCSLTGTGPCTLFSVFGVPPTVPPAGQSAYSFDSSGNGVMSVNGAAYSQIITQLTTVFNSVIDFANGGGTYVFAGPIQTPALFTTNITESNVGAYLTIFANGLGIIEAAAPTPSAGTDTIYPDSTAHRLKMNNNNGGAQNVLGSNDWATPGAIGSTTPNSVAATSINDSGVSANSPLCTDGSKNFSTACSAVATQSGSVGSTGVGIVLSGTSFAPLYGQYSSIISTSGNAQLAFGSTVPVSNLYVKLGTAAGASQTVAVTLLVNGSPSALTCTVPNSGSTCSDTTHSVSPTAGQLLDWQVVLNTSTLTTNVAIGGQAGNAVQGYSGNTTTAASVSGALTQNHVLTPDASGNVIDNGTALPNGTTATTQGTNDQTTKVANDAFVAASPWTGTNKTLIDPTNNINLICHSGPQSAITGNSAVQSVYSCTIPGNTLGANSCLHAHATWLHSTGSASVSYNFSYGGTGFSSAASASTNFAAADFYMCNNGATNSQYGSIGPATTGASALSFGSGTAAVDSTTSQTLAFTFNVANTDKVTPDFFGVYLDH